MDILERELQRPVSENIPRRFSPHALPNHMVSALPATVAMMFTCQGVNYVVSTSCTSSSQAIGNGFRHLQSGWEDIIIAGGADSGINPTIFAGFMALKAMSTRNEEPEKACRPFDRYRDGFVMGEGAGIVILEKLEHALARKAPIYAEITGFGSTSDAYHLTAPDPEGNSLARAMRMALHEAGRDGPGVDYINAHGTATRFNDMAETRALKQVFGRQAYQIPISSTKSMTGHLLGAAGGIEFIATVLTVTNGLIPPTINYECPDPECDLDYVPDEMREASIESAMSISLGFGGFNCALVISRYEP
jgi:3-oxoacyl-[acyl-carrier-protein] synthase II